MLRKLRLFLTVVLLSVSLTACGSQIGAKGVPNGTAELVVLDYLDEKIWMHPIITAIVLKLPMIMTKAQMQMQLLSI